MNPRIYKKQAKRAVQLLRSHGDSTKYTPNSEPGVMDEPFSWKRGRWLRKHRPAEYFMWKRISSIPEVSWCDFDGDWDGRDSRAGWMQHYDHARLPVDYWEGPEWECGGKPWPRLATGQRMGMWRHSQIAPGWRWRGGRAIKVMP
ncbi:MAG: hypothetical protein ACOH2S_20610 [Janthinobacterium svalbardensis]